MKTNNKLKIMEWKFEMTTLSTWPYSFSQVSFVAPPKHEPVVIKLGEDSDSESDRSDAESSKKKVSSNKNAGNGLFGGLEMMIKEARKSAEVSRIPIVWSDLHTVVSGFYYSMIAWYTMFSSSIIQLYVHKAVLYEKLKGAQCSELVKSKAPSI